MTDQDQTPPVRSHRHEELIREGEDHLTPEQIASLLESDPPADEAVLRGHLAACRRCFALYAEMAETELGWRWSPSSEELPADLELAAKEVGRRLIARAHALRPTRRAHDAWWMAAAAAVVVIGLGVVLWPRIRMGSSVDSSVSEVVRRAVATASRTGMVLTPDIAPAAPSLRGEASVDRRSLAESLNRMAQEYGRDSDESATYWLAAGMLAEKDPGVRTILDDALGRFPSSSRLANLSAVLAYREGRLDEAERMLTERLAAYPSDPALLFNLAYLLKERGREQRAHDIRARLLPMISPGNPIGVRAEQEFGDQPAK